MGAELQKKKEWGVGSVVVEFGVFGAPRFSVQRSQNACFKGIWDLWTENRGAPKTPNSTTTDPTPHSRPSDHLQCPNWIELQTQLQSSLLSERKALKLKQKEPKLSAANFYRKPDNARAQRRVGLCQENLRPRSALAKLIGHYWLCKKGLLSTYRVLN